MLEYVTRGRYMLKNVKKYNVLILLIILVLSFTTLSAANQLKVHYIDVGQGDSILIEVPDSYSMLIDGGPKSEANKLVSYLEKLRINKINYVVSTHPHTDHIGGLLTVLNDFEVEKIIDSGKIHTSQTYEDYLTLIDTKSIPYKLGRKGDKIYLGEAEFTVLHPDNTELDINNSSIVLLMKYGKTRFIFMGDSEREAENEILSSNKVIRAHFLKVGHHGSNTSTSKDFLEKVSPQVAIIMCGSDNSYGHPHIETINKLMEKEIKVYRTDKNGTIILSTDGNSFSTTIQYSNNEIKGKKEETNSSSNANKDNKVFVGSKESDKYHYPNCRWVEKILEKNKIWFSSVNDAKKAGYKPCGTCKPPAN
ncbi:MAG: MBL fold metallo-hydrolase [Halanaerobiales bacterium]|nr:MBL fold metallo-hydrolase [Halanaerobiales bacterium]